MGAFKISLFSCVASVAAWCVSTSEERSVVCNITSFKEPLRDMSLSKGTAHVISPKKSTESVAQQLMSSEGTAGSSPPGSSPKIHDSHDSKGRHSRSNSLIESQHIQHELKGHGDLVFAADSNGTMVLKGGNFLKLVEWVLASAGNEERALQNFIVAYRQWKPPMGLWRILMEKCVMHFRLVVSSRCWLWDFTKKKRFDNKSVEKADFHRKRYVAFSKTLWW